MWHNLADFSVCTVWSCPCALQGGVNLLLRRLSWKSASFGASYVPFWYPLAWERGTQVGSVLHNRYGWVEVSMAKNLPIIADTLQILWQDKPTHLTKPTGTYGMKGFYSPCAWPALLSPT